MAQRRRTYVFEVDGRPVQCLCYSREWALAHLHRKYPSATVVPAKKVKAEVVPSAMERARTTLNLKLPVKVKFTKTKTKGGVYKGVYDGHHVVHVSAYPGRALDFLNASLWHELGHALQCERDWNGDHLAFFRDYNRDIRGRSMASRVSRKAAYNTSRYEIEANAISAQYRWLSLLR